MLSRTMQAAPTPAFAKVFCFFSSEKKALLAAWVLLARRAEWVIFNDDWYYFCVRQTIRCRRRFQDGPVPWTIAIGDRIATYESFCHLPGAALPNGGPADIHYVLYFP